MQAGRLRHRCTLKTQQRLPDGMGGHHEDWQTLISFWAEINIPTGRTAAVSQQLQATVTAEILARPNPELTPGRRVICGDAVYKIEAVLPDNRNTRTRLLCSSVPNP